MAKPFGLYIHWPFCLKKCPYCDFNSHVRERIDEDHWHEAMLRELETAAAELPQDFELQSIFFGGGTPSLMPPRITAALIERARTLWPTTRDLEVTLEANPSTVERARFQAFHDAGVNRLSIGIQALNDADLKMLGRLHDAPTALQALEAAKQVFTRVSFDLIYARPGQSLEAWREELTQALDLSAGHLSLYQLTIEPGTAFATLYQRGELRLPEDQLAGDLFELTQELAQAAGLPAYEISNHARPGQESRHNLIYWRMQDYLGIGPGAHSRLHFGSEDVRIIRRHRAPEVWLSRVQDQGHGTEESVAVTKDQQVTEILMMGLRLAEGVPAARLKTIAPQAWQALTTSSAVKDLIEEGYLTLTQDRITATPAGRQRLNLVLQHLLRDL
ncbi:MAG: radical SAM family heme chaperone HemW [Holosporales bacterium]